MNSRFLLVIAFTIAATNIAYELFSVCLVFMNDIVRREMATSSFTQEIPIEPMLWHVASYSFLLFVIVRLRRKN